VEFRREEGDKHRGGGRSKGGEGKISDRGRSKVIETISYGKTGIPRDQAGEERGIRDTTTQGE